MLIMRGPGGFTGGRVIDAMVTHLDLYPTLCDVAGVDRPAWLQGPSLLPLVRGEADELHDEIFAEMTYHAAYEPQRAVRTERWKYIRRFDDHPRPVLAELRRQPEQGRPARGRLGASGRRRASSSTTSCSTRTRSHDLVRRRRAGPASSPTMRAAARPSGWARPTIPCSTGRSRRRPARVLNEPAQRSPSDPVATAVPAPSGAGAE